MSAWQALAHLGVGHPIGCIAFKCQTSANGNKFQFHKWETRLSASINEVVMWSTGDGHRIGHAGYVNCLLS